VEAAEGGCGVTGFACNVPIAGKHIYAPSVQMHNRGNGKGGGIAAVGLVPEKLGVSRKVLDEDYIIQVALLDPSAEDEVEKEFIEPAFDVDAAGNVETVQDYRDIEGLEVRPPDVRRYFVRAKQTALEKFAQDNGLKDAAPRDIEDEFVYQNSFRLNVKLYASLGEKRAFVLSHGRNMCVFKIVGYAEQAAQYYQLEDLEAHVWIAHQRYPTKGRVWHPGGAHPFCGMHEALVHNGDFANYYSVCEYLGQRNIKPLFLTDTEVSVLLFDLWNRLYKYPLEYIIEALAPTTERDFDHLPPEKQRIYRHIQATHIHASPDGPWFFIIGRNEPERNFLQLIGITDTAMLRPQVFALQEGAVQIGLICSEKQAIDATLQSLAKDDSRFCSIADRYWNARGGSHTDGGAFMFTITPNGDGEAKLTCTDKFGRVISTPPHQNHADLTLPIVHSEGFGGERQEMELLVAEGCGRDVYDFCRERMARWSFNEVRLACRSIVETASRDDTMRAAAIEALTLLNDRRYPTGEKKRSSVLDIIHRSLHQILGAVQPIGKGSGSRYAYLDWENRAELRPPSAGEEILVVNAGEFPPQGDDSDARLVVQAYQLGWKRFICYGYVGQRFLGCGLGPNTEGVVIDAYDSTGDYLGSGIDGMTINVHWNGQDQLGQILRRGRLVVHGDVGQTFLYGAKGGRIFVLGNAAGRPLINAVGRPRVVINGTCLDYLAESFMAGDPLRGGGFVVLNGMELDDEGRIVEMDTPYPGGNLFSLASGGAIYVRDPHRRLTEDQLNAGQFFDLTPADWQLVESMLKENEREFGITIEELLTVDGVVLPPEKVYRKVGAVKLAVLTELPEESE
jgi:glutamate synthase domain-containing protein 1/glutamate synthase domain-containing protein 3